MSNPTPKTEHLKATQYVTPYKSQRTAKRLQTTVSLDAKLARQVDTYLKANPKSTAAELCYLALKEFFGNA